MAIKKFAGSPFLYDDNTGDIIGIKDPDGSELYFARQYGLFYDTTDQTASANTATVMTFNTVDGARGVSIVSNSRIRVAEPGIYDLQFSAQLTNADTQEHDISVWLRKNGTDVANSNTFIGVPATHGGMDGHAVAAWNIPVTLAAGDYVEICWSTPNVAVSIQHIPAQTGPVRPGTPSVIATLYQMAT